MPCLETLEHLVFTHQLRPALNELGDILKLLYDTGGNPGEQLQVQLYAGLAPAEQDKYVMTRFAVAISVLLSNPDLTLSLADYQKLVVFRTMIDNLFAASVLRNADHVIPALLRPGTPREAMQVEGRHLLKYCLLLTSDSNLPFDPQALWQCNKQMAAALFIALLAEGMMTQPQAHAKREKLLAWLPGHLEEIDAFEALPIPLLHGAYMLCSYADLEQKYEIKKPLNRLMRKQLLATGLHDLPAPAKKRAKPVMVVILEWLSRGHAIYRTHSSTLRALSEDFTLHAVGYDYAIDATGRAVFEHFHELDFNKEFFQTTRQVWELARKLQPDVVYYPSIGMMHLTIFMSNLRLAPLQISGLGHAGTTHSPYIDCMLFEEGYLGDASLFSERVIALPHDSMPHVLPIEQVTPPPRVPRAPHEPIRIAVVATFVKLNPHFLIACQAIASRSTVPLEFYFFDGMSNGVVFLRLVNAIRHYLPDAKIKNRLPYAELMSELAECDLFLDPFPFGNMNGLVDTFLLHLPGVCLSRKDKYFNIDEGLMRRMKMPDWLITYEIDEFVAAALRLIHEPATRDAISQHLTDMKPEHVIFTGKPEKFSKAVMSLL